MQLSTQSAQPAWTGRSMFAMRGAGLGGPNVSYYASSILVFFSVTARTTSKGMPAYTWRTSEWE